VPLRCDTIRILMDFSIPERVREIAGPVRSFVDQEVIPLERVVFARGFGAVQGELGRRRETAKGMELFAPTNERPARLREPAALPSI
jgi:hypothetical protein